MLRNCCAYYLWRRRMLTNRKWSCLVCCENTGKWSVIERREEKTREGMKRKGREEKERWKYENMKPNRTKRKSNKWNNTTRNETKRNKTKRKETNSFLSVLLPYLSLSLSQSHSLSLSLSLSLFLSLSLTLLLSLPLSLSFSFSPSLSLTLCLCVCVCVSVCVFVCVAFSLSLSFSLYLSDISSRSRTLLWGDVKNFPGISSCVGNGVRWKTLLRTWKPLTWCILGIPFYCIPIDILLSPVWYCTALFFPGDFLLHPYRTTHYSRIVK